MTQWEKNAKIVENVYGCYVDWEERFYTCPECGDVVYEVDWSDKDLAEELCPICGYNGEEDTWWVEDEDSID